jgi:hypothetical protein
MNRRDFWKFLPAVPAVALAKIVLAKGDTANPNVIHTDGAVTIQNCVFHTDGATPALQFHNRKEKK